MKSLVNVRKFCEADIPNKVCWINNPDNNKYLHYDLPLCEDKTRIWFLNNQDRRDRYDAVIEFDNIPVGIIGLLCIVNDSAEFYITMGESSFKGKGIAKCATINVLDYAFNILELENVYLYTEVDNIPAQKLFEKCGFVRQKIEKNSAVNKGKFVDRYYYTISQSDFHSISE